jgi:hypothetical protein
VTITVGRDRWARRFGEAAGLLERRVQRTRLTPENTDTNLE